VRRRRIDDRSRVRVREEVQPVYPKPGAGDEEASQAADETDRHRLESTARRRRSEELKKKK